MKWNNQLYVELHPPPLLIQICISIEAHVKTILYYPFIIQTWFVYVLSSHQHNHVNFYYYCNLKNIVFFKSIWQDRYGGWPPPSSPHTEKNLCGNDLLISVYYTNIIYVCFVIWSWFIFCLIVLPVNLRR